MVLLDEGILKQQRFFFRISQQDIQISDFGYQKLDLIAGISGSRKIGTHALTQIAGLAHVNDLIRCVFHQVDTGRIGQQAYFFL